MCAMASLLAERGVRVVRFEFSYMAGRRTGGSKRPPAAVPALIAEFRDLLAPYRRTPIFVGGKSLGGRVASMLAAEQVLAEELRGVLCFGYPFHPPGKPDKLRTSHLDAVTCPMLVMQGERDPFGTMADVAQYALPQSVELHWAVAGNHDLVPSARSGLTADDNWTAAADAAARFIHARAG